MWDRSKKFAFLVAVICGLGIIGAIFELGSSAEEQQTNNVAPPLSGGAAIIKFPPLPDKNGIKIANIEAKNDVGEGGFYYVITLENTNNEGFVGTISVTYVLYGETRILSNYPFGMLSHKKDAVGAVDEDKSRPADPNFHVVSFETTGRKSNS